MALTGAEIARRYRARHPERARESLRRSRLKFREKYAAYARAYQRKHVAVARAFIDAARAGGCVDCGIKHLGVLQSDHVRGKKVAPVSRLVTGPLHALFAELDKCETRCANCHALVTTARRKAA